MRREGYIIEEIIDYSNMAESFKQVLRGKKRKRCRQGRYLLAHQEEVIQELTKQIAEGSFKVSGYREKEIIEGGKLRRIQVLSMKDRIAVHAIMAIVDKHLKKRFYPYYLRKHRGARNARPDEVHSTRPSGRSGRNPVLLQVRHL